MYFANHGTIVRKGSWDGAVMVPFLTNLTKNYFDCGGLITVENYFETRFAHSWLVQPTIVRFPYSGGGDIHG